MLDDRVTNDEGITRLTVEDELPRDLYVGLGRVLSTLASDDRRAILELLTGLRDDGEVGMSISQVAEGLGSTRFSASRHLRIMHESGLVTATRRGPATIYSVRVEPLWRLEDWIISIAHSD
jgi:DNA-binding transcriptional ArsR family regulator